MDTPPPGGENHAARRDGGRLGAEAGASAEHDRRGGHERGEQPQVQRTLGAAQRRARRAGNEAVQPAHRERADAVEEDLDQRRLDRLQGEEERQPGDRGRDVDPEQRQRTARQQGHRVAIAGKRERQRAERATGRRR
jgi:hypothetical protein